MLPKCPDTGKNSYRSRGEALRSVWIANHTRCGYRPAHRAYVCEHCGRWHLTKQDYTRDVVARKQQRAHAQLRRRDHHD